MQAPRADVLGALVHRERDLGDAAHALGCVIELDAFGREQRLVLPGEARIGRGEDALEILDRQARELDADGQPPLQLRQEVRGFRHVEGA